MNPPKYKREDLLYSYQNKDYPAPVSRVRESHEEGSQHAYKLTLKNEHGTRSSHWIDENSLTENPQ